MCIIQSGYFTVNGSQGQCTTPPENQVAVECAVSFSGAEIGKQYKAELKIKLPTGVDFSFYTGYKTVTSTETFTANFVKPAPLGTYNTVWFVIYDTSGNTACASSGASGGCTTLTVSGTAPPPGNGTQPPVVCPPDKVNIIGSCVSKSTLMIGGAVLVGLMMLKR